MSNQFLKLRRSAIPGRVPTTSSLDFGEIALNTYDGLAFIKKSGSLGEEVISIGGSNIYGTNHFVPIFSGSNTLVTSSIFQSGSYTSIRNSTGPEDPTNPDILYVNGDGVDTYNIISAHGNFDDFIQINIQNYNTGGFASSDIVATKDDGTESYGYINMGINGSQYTNSAFVGGASDAYLYSLTNGNLYIGNAESGKEVIIFNGGLDAAANSKIWIHDQGTIGINTATYNTINPPSLQIAPPNLTTYNLIQARGQVNSYLQTAVTNASPGTEASADMVAYNNIDPDNQLAGYIDVGINSTNYAPNTTYPGDAGHSYIFTDSDTLIIGTVSGSLDELNLFVGSANADTGSKLKLRANNQHSMTGSLQITGSVTGSSDFLINGLTVGRGGGNRSNNTAIGISALVNNASVSNGTANVAVGYQAAMGNNSGNLNVAVGALALSSSLSGGANTIVGSYAARSAQTSWNVGVGTYALNNLSIGSDNVAIGARALYENESGSYNVVVGRDSGRGIISGSYNTILGSQLQGLPAGLANNIIISDGQGNIKYRWDATQNNIYGNLAVTGSVTATTGFTGSLFGTSSWAQNFLTSSVSSASLATTASYALTASFGANFTASNILVNGTLTAQTIVAQVITSSTEYITGSTQFGSLLSNTHQFTGSVSMTGSLTSYGRLYVRPTSSLPYLYIDVNAGLYPSLNAMDSSNVKKSQWINSPGNGSMYFDYEGLNSGGNLNFRRTMDSDSYTVARFVSSGNLLLQNAGTFTDNGYKLQVNSSGSVSGSLYSNGFSVFDGILSGSQPTNNISSSLLLISGSINPTGSLANTSAVLINTQISASANNQLLSALDISPTFNVGAYTGTSTYGIRIRGNYTNYYDYAQIIEKGTLYLLNGNLIIGGAGALTFGNSTVTIKGSSTGVGANDYLDFTTNNTKYARMFSNGGLLLQNGGTFTDNGFRLQLNGSGSVSGALWVSGSSVITGSLTVTQGITGSLYGTASWATNFITSSVTSASYAGTASVLLGSIQSASYALTASYALNAGGAASTFPYTGNAVISGSLTVTGSNIVIGNQIVSGSTRTSGSVSIVSSGSGIFTVDGTSGRLFSIDDSLSGSLFSVNTAAGLPIIEAFSDNTVRIGQFGRQALFVSQSKVGIGKESNLNGILDISGSATITGSLIVSASAGVTYGLDVYNSNARVGGTLDVSGLGWVRQYNPNQNFLGGALAIGKQTLPSSGYILEVTGSSIMTGSLIVTQGITGSLFGTASWASNFITSSVTSASYAQTASYGANFTASNLLVNNTITAQTLVVQTITSSIEYSSGSNIFGSQLSNTQQFTGSLSATGSLHTFYGIISASNTIHIDVTQPTYALDTVGRILYSNYYLQYADLPNSNVYHGMFAHVHATGSAYYSHGSHGWVRIWDTYNNPGLISGSQVVENIAGQAIAPLTVSASSWISASQFVGSGSGIVGVVTSSYALTASYALNGGNVAPFPYSGSAIITGSLGVTGSISIMSGALQLKPSKDPDPSGANLTDTFLFVSASNTTLGQDLYVRQDGNMVKWKWIEGGISSGLLYGGVISGSGTTIYVSSGSGIIVNMGAATGSEINPTLTYVKWNSYSGSVQNLTSSQNTYLYVDNTGTVRQQSSYFDQTQYEQAIPLGRVIHANYTSITSFGSNVQTTYDSDSQQNDFIRAFGPIKVNGFSPSGQSGSLRINVGAGTAFNLGGYYSQDPNSPSHYTSTQQISCSIVRAYRSGSGIYQDNNGGSFYTVIDPAHYDDGTGILNSVSPGQYSIQRIYFNPVTKRSIVYYGQTTYNSISTALTNLSTDPTTEGEFSAKSLVFAGYLIVQGGASNLADTSQAQFINAGLFRNTAGSSGGGAIAQTLNDLSDVTITSPVNGQALIYNSGIWINGVQTSASYATTSSYALVAQNVLGSITSASYAGTASVLLGSIQSASYAATASWALNFITSSVTSASYAATASYVVSSSYASTLNKKVRNTLPIMAVQGQTTYITAIPAVADEIGTELRVRENLSNVSSCSLSTRVESGGAGAGFLKVQYSTDEATWNDLVSTVPSIIDLSLASTQLGSEVPIPSGAKTTGTYLRLITISGSGAADAVSRFGNVTLNLIYDL